jgi:hypothetical protein
MLLKVTIIVVLICVVHSLQARFTYHSAPFLPDNSLTPGHRLGHVTAKDVCQPGWSKSHRNVTANEKKEVYKIYGIEHHEKGEYEIDHLISLELGGANTISNLWPQSYYTDPWNAHVKDKFENRLHKLVCNDEISLHEAQNAIAEDWISSYKKLMKE